MHKLMPEVSARTQSLDLHTNGLGSCTDAAGDPEPDLFGRIRLGRECCCQYLVLRAVAGGYCIKVRQAAAVIAVRIEHDGLVGLYQNIIRHIDLDNRCPLAVATGESSTAE